MTINQLRALKPGDKVRVVWRTGTHIIEEKGFSSRRFIDGKTHDEPYVYLIDSYGMYWADYLEHVDDTTHIHDNISS